LTLATVPGPARRAKTHQFAAVKRHQDPINEQVGPAEAGVPPRNVIGVHHGRVCNGILQACRQGGLPAGAAPIYRQYDTLSLAPGSSPATKPEQGLNDHRQRHGMPGPALGLLGSESECHDHGLPSQWFSRAYVIHRPPLLLPELLACLPAAPPKIIP
jgi:hypothetical protein